MSSTATVQPRPVLSRYPHASLHGHSRSLSVNSSSSHTVPPIILPPIHISGSHPLPILELETPRPSLGDSRKHEDGESDSHMDVDVDDEDEHGDLDDEGIAYRTPSPNRTKQASSSSWPGPGSRIASLIPPEHMGTPFVRPSLSVTSHRRTPSGDLDGREADVIAKEKEVYESILATAANGGWWKSGGSHLPTTVSREAHGHDQEKNWDEDDGRMRDQSDTKGPEHGMKPPPGQPQGGQRLGAYPYIQNHWSTHLRSIPQDTRRAQSHDCLQQPMPLYGPQSSMPIPPHPLPHAPQPQMVVPAYTGPIAMYNQEREVVAGAKEAVLSEKDKEIIKTRRHACPICAKRFNRPSSLQTHLSVHTGAKPYVCMHEDCGRRFSVSSNLRRHEKTTHARSKTRSPSTASQAPHLTHSTVHSRNSSLSVPSSVSRSSISSTYSQPQPMTHLHANFVPFQGYPTQQNDLRSQMGAPVLQSFSLPATQGNVSIHGMGEVINQSTPRQYPFFPYQPQPVNQAVNAYAHPQSYPSCPPTAQALLPPPVYSVQPTNMPQDPTLIAPDSMSAARLPSIATHPNSYLNIPGTAQDLATPHVTEQSHSLELDLLPIPTYIPPPSANPYSAGVGLESYQLVSACKRGSTSSGSVGSS